MPRITHFIEDTQQPLVMQLGTTREPYDLTGKDVKIALRDIDSNERITSGTTVVQDPPTAGRAQRLFETAELVLGRIFVVEAIINENEATFPDGNQQKLEVKMESRRTTPTP